MEDVTARQVVVTGATSGIGLAAAVELSRQGDEVTLVGRNPARLAAAADEVRRAGGRRPPTFRADFAVLDDVRRLAEDLRSTYEHIDVLVNNAGSLIHQPKTTVDGHEMSMQVNHLAPFLLTNLLADRVTKVVTTASDAYRVGRLNPDDLSAELHPYRAFIAYGTSKQANILFTVEAGRHWPGVFAVAFHPGMVRTRFATENPIIALGMKLAPFLRTPAQGADTLVWLARTETDELTNGGYYIDRRLRKPRRKLINPDLAARLWRASEAAVGLA